jgi:hypothetical protein
MQKNKPPKYQALKIKQEHLMIPPQLKMIPTLKVSPETGTVF